jgi:broad specificity phosphatase PhoE
MKEEKWNKKEWMVKAKNLLNNLTEFPKNSKITMVIRHSARKSAEDIRQDTHYRLTDLGHTYANYFGRELSKERKIKLYHSQIERCKETAKGILKGLNDSGGEGKIMGALEVLYDVGISDDDFYDQVEEHPFEDFLYRWVAGLFPKEIIPPFPDYVQKAADSIWNIHKERENNSLTIHVTHDLIILCLRLGWFGLKPTETWPPFLNGFAFTFKENEILVFDFDHFTEVKYPYWWSNNNKNELK